MIPKISKSSTVNKGVPVFCKCILNPLKDPKFSKIVFKNYKLIFNLLNFFKKLVKRKN
jgi:hypothetical protein